MFSASYSTANYMCSPMTLLHYIHFWRTFSSGASSLLPRSTIFTSFFFNSSHQNFSYAVNHIVPHRAATGDLTVHLFGPSEMVRVFCTKHFCKIYLEAHKSLRKTKVDNFFPKYSDTWAVSRSDLRNTSLPVSSRPQSVLTVSHL